MKISIDLQGWPRWFGAEEVYRATCHRCRVSWIDPDPERAKLAARLHGVVTGHVVVIRNEWRWRRRRPR